MSKHLRAVLEQMPKAVLVEFMLPRMRSGAETVEAMVRELKARKARIDALAAERDMADAGARLLELLEDSDFETLDLLDDVQDDYDLALNRLVRCMAVMEGMGYRLAS